MENNDQQVKKSGRGFLAGFVLCILLAGFLLFSSVFRSGGGTPSAELPGSPSVSAETEGSRELSVTDLMKAVLTLKDDLETSVDDIKAGELEAAREKINGIPGKTQTIRSSLDVTMEALGDSMPSLQTQLTNIQSILDLVDLTTQTLLQPALVQLEENPLSELRVGDGVNTKVICRYLDFVQSRMPDVEAVVAQAEAVDLSLVDSEGKMAAMLGKADRLLELYRQDNSLIDRIKSIFGADGDRLYVVAAQNSAEIRASGGFPGAVGSVEIRDGILTLNDFKKVYDVFSPYTPAKADITTTEFHLFHGGLSVPRDADFCPDFERVAEIWAMGYETRMGREVDGVISVTPAVVQKLLAAVDDEIVLFDGMVLSGENAARGLQHDLYFKYFGKEYVSGAGVVTDQLFADAAKKTTLKLMEHMEIGNLTDYVSIAGECFADRTLMLWSKDGAEQELISALGWNGGLNADPQKPQAGVYYNCTVASKMGWFLIVDAQMGEGTCNSDGSYTYPVTVTFSNDITPEEIRSAQAYITGGNGGAIGGSAYFFAPAGGAVSDFQSDNGVLVQKREYHGLELGFMPSFNISPGKGVTVTYNVTTAPGVDARPEISRTPTMQDYH